MDSSDDLLLLGGGELGETKHLLLHFEGELLLHSHLRMTGSWDEGVSAVPLVSAPVSPSACTRCSA